MIIGALVIDLKISYASSLKEKRKILNRIRDRVHAKFNVSVAEVDGNEDWNYSQVGVAVVCNEQKYANRILSKVLDVIENIRGCELTDYSMEFERI